MRAIWNEALMEDAVCSAYIMMLEDLTRICNPEQYAFPTLWPQLNMVDGNGMQLLQVFVILISSCSCNSVGGQYKIAKCQKNLGRLWLAYTEL